VQLDLVKYLVCRAVARSADPDTAAADRIALFGGLMDFGLVQSAVLTAAIAGNQAPPPEDGAGAAARNVFRLGRRGPRRPAPARTRVPGIRHLADREAIERHLAERKLRARIHTEEAVEIKAPRVAHQWPAEEAEVVENSVIDVVLLVPKERGAGGGSRA
jgi:hypothetical protein